MTQASNCAVDLAQVKFFVLNYFTKPADALSINGFFYCLNFLHERNKNMNNPLKLYAPKEYWNAKKEELNSVTNGCGAEGWKGQLVPETLWGLSVTSACNIHDWMYTFPKISTIEDKKLADRVFLNNMVRIINHHHENDSCAIGCILKKLRLRRAKIYYEAVSTFGGDAFWAGKNTDENFKMLEERDVA